MELKAGDRVYYKDDDSKAVFFVYAIYGKGKVSLGLRDYPDVEQDYLTDVDQLIKIETRRVKK